MKLHHIDILGFPVNLLHNGMKNHSNKLSILLSLCLIIIMIASAFAFGLEIFQRKNPFYTTGTSYTNQSRINLTHFPMTFKIIDGLGQTVPNYTGLFNITARLYYLQENIKGVIPVVTKDYKLSPCNLTKHISPEFREFANDTSTDMITDALCVDLTPQDYIQNNYATVMSAFIDISVFKCIGNDSLCNNKELAAPTRIYNFLTQFIDSYVDMTKPDPKVHFLNTIVSKLPMNNLTKRNYATFFNYDLYLDEGMAYESIKYETGYSYSNKITLDVDSISPVFPGRIHQLTMDVSNFVTKYNRKYFKFQDLFAQLGGLLKAFQTIILMLSYVVLKNDFLIDLANWIFSEAEILPQGNLTVISNTSAVQVNNFTDFTKIFPNQIQDTPVKENNPIIKTRKLNYTVMSYFSILCAKRRNKKIYNSLISITEKKLELGKVIRMNFQLELIKNYLLPEDSRPSFDMKIPLNMVLKEYENKTSLIQVYDDFIKDENIMKGDLTKVEAVLESILNKD